jgi:hypothetical protein
MAAAHPNRTRELELYRVPEAPAKPTPVLVLDSLGRMHPATAIALIGTAGGMLAGAVVAVVSLAAAVMVAAVAIVGIVAIGAGAAAAVVLVLKR